LKYNISTDIFKC